MMTLLGKQIPRPIDAVAQPLPMTAGERLFVNAG
jgi:hypothetical protein